MGNSMRTASRTSNTGALTGQRNSYGILQFANGSGYKLNIHHKNDNGKADGKNMGHFFLSLEENGKATFFGKYSTNGGPIGREKILSKEEAETFDNLKKMEIEDNKKYLDTETIILTKQQYDKAFEFAKDKFENQETNGARYCVLFADCTDFVQAVYHAAGRPLNFASVYTRNKLKELRTLASLKLLFISYWQHWQSH